MISRPGNYFMKPLREYQCIVMKKLSLFLIWYPFGRNPWDMTKESNVILTVMIQCCAAPIVVYFIMIPEFFFLAISKYFNNLIDDVKNTIENFNQTSQTLTDAFIEMINLHERSLGYELTVSQVLGISIEVFHFCSILKVVPRLWSTYACTHLLCEYA